MKRGSTDPAEHRATERRVADHVLRLLEDRRLVVPTRFGPVPVTALRRDLSQWDRAVEVKKALVAAGVADYELQEAMPTGEVVDVALVRKVLFVFDQTVGHLRFVSLPPTDALARGEDPAPLTAEQVREAVGKLPPPRGEGPMTLVLLSTAGFTQDALDTARTFTDGPPTILISPNEVGGFEVVGPPAAQFLTELLNPETMTEQYRRVEQAIEENKVELITGGITADLLARQTQLQPIVVQQAMREYARREGLRFKSVAGEPMLFREGTGVSTAGAGASSGIMDSGALSGERMALMDKLRGFFGKSGEEQRKIAFLSERRAELARQRDASFEEMDALEKREAELRGRFKESDSTLARRRITSQLVQLRKDIERRQQLLGVLNQQINVVGTHLHNLEVVRQGTGGRMPSSETIAEDAARAEEVLAELQASSELADEMGGVVSTSGLTAEEQALYDELEAEVSADRQHAAETQQVETGEQAPLARPRPSEPLNRPVTPPPISPEKRPEAEPG